MPLTPFRPLARTALLLMAVIVAPCTRAADFTQVLGAIKPSVVAVASVDKSKSAPLTFAGTGFAIADGLTVVTNAHVIRTMAATQADYAMGIVIVRGNAMDVRRATLLRIDAEHDLALLKIDGVPLPVMALGEAANVKEGQSVAFTGFPLGAQIGLRHVTHRAMVSAITPIVIAAPDAKRLDTKAVAQIKKQSFDVFQLDGTAYPGNSGSPVFDVDTGAALGIINMVYVKGLKETAITNPSGIAYAIPINHVRDLLIKPN